MSLTTTTIDAPHAAPFNASEINAILIALRAVDVAAGTDKRTHYFGLVDDAGGFMRGLASGIPSSPAPGTVASGPTGPLTFGWDADGSYGDWYTGHELGTHLRPASTPNSAEPPAEARTPTPTDSSRTPTAAYVGLDVGDPALRSPCGRCREPPGTTS